jgi:hypothetical protein
VADSWWVSIYVWENLDLKVAGSYEIEGFPLKCPFEG